MTFDTCTSKERKKTHTNKRIQSRLQKCNNTECLQISLWLSALKLVGFPHKIVIFIPIDIDYLDEYDSLPAPKPGVTIILNFNDVVLAMVSSHSRTLNRNTWRPFSLPQWSRDHIIFLQSAYLADGDSVPAGSDVAQRAPHERFSMVTLQSREAKRTELLDAVSQLAHVWLGVGLPLEGLVVGDLRRLGHTPVTHENKNLHNLWPINMTSFAKETNLALRSR